VTSQRSGHSSGDGSFARDAGTQTAKAIVLVGLAVLVGVLMLSHTSNPKAPVRTAATHTPAMVTPTTTAPSSTSTTTPAPAPDTVKVLVFNGTTTPHGAGYFQNKLAQLGYNALAPENAEATDVTSTEVFATSSAYLPSADAIARALGVGTSAVHSGVPAATPVSLAVVRQLSPNVVVLVGADIANQSLGYVPSSSTTTPSTSTSGSGAASTSG
jgi:hypothetical protein